MKRRRLSAAATTQERLGVAQLAVAGLVGVFVFVPLYIAFTTRLPRATLEHPPRQPQTPVFDDDPEPEIPVLHPPPPLPQYDPPPKQQTQQAQAQQMLQGTFYRPPPSVPVVAAAAAAAAENASTVSAQQQQQPLFRVLFVADAYAYTKSMSRWFFHMHEAFAELPGVEAVLWGPGFPGYRENLTTAENVELRWGVSAASERFDFFFNHTMRHRSKRTWMGPGTSAPPVAVWHHECLRPEYLPTVHKHWVIFCPHDGAQLFFHTYANHMAYYAHEGHDKLLWHLPHAARLKDFPQPPPAHAARATDVLIIGDIHNKYPLRQRYLQMLNNSRLPGVARRYEHPGFWMHEDENGAAGTVLTEDDIQRGVAELETQTAAYSNAILDAKIVLLCSSLRNYAVRKFVEASMAGSLVIGDIPGEREDEFRSWVVEVRRSNTDEEILSAINWWLAHPAERQERADFGRRIAVERYSTTQIALQALDAMRRYVAGQRGLVFNYPFAPINYFLPTCNCDAQAAPPTPPARTPRKRPPRPTTN